MARRGIELLVAGLVLLAGCSSGAGPTATPTTAPTGSVPTPTQAGAAVVLAVATSTYGNHLTAGNKALYVLVSDSATTSTCDGGCARNWPPLIVEGAGDVLANPAVTGALTTFARSDGTMQVAIGGHPVYWYGGDAAAGDVNGQGKGDVWFLAAPDGTPLSGSAVTTPAPCACTQAPPTTPDSTDDGYGDYGGG